MDRYTPEELESHRLTGNEIDSIIAINQTKVTAFKKQESYYRGANYTILSEDKKDNPDNRLSISFGRKAVNTVAGYMAKVGNVTFQSEDEQTQNRLNKINEINNADIVTNTELVKSLVNGVGYELHYMTDNEPKFAVIDAQNIIPFYDNELTPNIYRFIYHYTVSNIEYIESSELEVIDYFADVYYQDKVEHWFKKGTEGTYELLSEEPHFYEDLPIVEYTINQDKDNLFDHVIDIIDTHDKVMSEDIANELERFANTYLMMSYHIDGERTDENGKTDLDKIKEKRIFQGLDKEDFIKWLTKEVNDAFITNSADRFERLIYEMLQIPNFNDKEFGTSSGIAIAYKLIDFENLCSAIEAFFTIGLKRRYELIKTVSAKQLNDIDAIQIKWIRNLPFDIKGLSETVEKLTSILSEETILRMFPKSIVPDVQEELEKVGEEKDADAERISNSIKTEEPIEPQLEIDDEQ